MAGVFAMNFFGHAWLARRREAARGSVRAEFVLGAMLPDFASMLRTRPPQASLEALKAGLDFHHLTDDAFHGSRSFLEFCREASSYLGGRGVARGSARAVAHVGVELLLDGAFAREDSANEAYLSAVECGLTGPVTSHIQWPTADIDARFQSLCRALRQRGALPSETPPERLAERLRSILADRPRLAMDARAQSVVREWLETAGPRVVAGAPLLLSEVERRLPPSA